MVNTDDIEIRPNNWSISGTNYWFVVGLRGGIEAEKLSLKTNLVIRIHFPKPQNSHEAKTLLCTGLYRVFHPFLFEVFNDFLFGHL